jgi:uracil-DNA glycosylase
MDKERISDLGKDEVFQAISSQIAQCTKCNLYQGRNNPVPGEGNLNASLFFVGEGPGANEDIQGRPFVGQAGKVLDQLLASIALQRSDVFIGNAVKCRPPGNRTPLIEEIRACEDFLLAQLALIEPKVVVLLGNAALTALLGANHSISRVRGTLIEHQGMNFFPIFHPAACLYRREIFEQMKQDFMTLKNIMKEKVK